MDVRSHLAVGRILGSLLLLSVAQYALLVSAQSPQRGTISVGSLRAPEKAREQLYKAMLAFRKNDIRETEQRLDAALAAAPEYAEALSFRGFLELNSQRFDAAMIDLQRALRADPSLAITHLYMGSLLNHLGRYDDALLSLERNAHLDPHSWACAYERARSWLGKHNYANALIEVNRAVELGGEAKMGNAMRLLRGHALYGLKQYDKANVELQAYVAADPNGKLTPVAREIMDRIERESTVAER